MEQTKVSAATLAAARSLTEDADAVALRVAEHIRREVPDYVDNPLVSDEDLIDSCRSNISYILGTLTGHPTAGLQSAHDTGARRADQGLSYASLMAAYRTGTRFVWDELVRHTPADSRTELLADAPTTWQLGNAFADAASVSFNLVTMDRVRRDQDLRSTLVGSLLDGTVSAAADWNAAVKLGFTGGEFVVVAAACPEPGIAALAQIEHVLTTRRVISAWRLSSDNQEGIVSLRQGFGTDQLDAEVRRIARLPVGISAQFSRLEDATEALQQARLALGSGGPTSADVVRFGDQPIGALLVGNPTGTDEILRILAPVFADPRHDAGELLRTVRCWFETGSTAEAADRLHMHRNTVRGRLDRIAELTGLDTGEPAQAAVLYLALEAARIRGLL